MMVCLGDVENMETPGESFGDELTSRHLRAWVCDDGSSGFGRMQGGRNSALQVSGVLGADVFASRIRRSHERIVNS